MCDLEDAVAPSEKGRARELVARLLAEVQTACARMVRVNGIDTPYWREDLAAIEGLSLDAVVVPKATPQAISALGEEGPPLLALIETAAGVRL
ncbi:MAG: CoA ester lyase, partial [Thermoleophilia bacterium]